MADEQTEVSETTSGETNDDVLTPELEAKINEVFDKESSSDRKEARATPPQAQRKRQTQSSEEAESVNDELAEPGSDETQTDQPTDQPKQPVGKEVIEDDPITTLDPVLRKVAQRAKWTDEQLREALDLNPEATTNTLKTLHGSFNDLSARFASFANPPQNQGYQQPPETYQQPQYQQPQRQPVQPSPASGGGKQVLEQLFGKDYEAKLAVNYGDTFIEDVINPLLGTVIEPVMRMQQEVERQRVLAVADEVNKTFGELSKQLPDVYGDPSKNRLTQEQDAFRQQVLVYADQIRSGATMQGVPMSVSEAIENAHLAVASQHLQRIEREKLTQQVTDRSRRITARPTQRGFTGAGKGMVKSREAAIAAFEQKAAEMGLDT